MVRLARRLERAGVVHDDSLSGDRIVQIRLLAHGHVGGAQESHALGIPRRRLDALAFCQRAPRRGSERVVPNQHRRLVDDRDEGAVVRIDGHPAEVIIHLAQHLLAAVTQRAKVQILRARGDEEREGHQRRLSEREERIASSGSAPLRVRKEYYAFSWMFRFWSSNSVLQVRFVTVCLWIYLIGTFSSKIRMEQFKHTSASLFMVRGRPSRRHVATPNRVAGVTRPFPARRAHTQGERGPFVLAAPGGGRHVGRRRRSALRQRAAGAAVAACVSAVVVNPLDVVKTRIRAQGAFATVKNGGGGDSPRNPRWWAPTTCARLDAPPPATSASCAPRSATSTRPPTTSSARSGGRRGPRRCFAGRPPRSPSRYRQWAYTCRADVCLGELKRRLGASEWGGSTRRSRPSQRGRRRGPSRCSAWRP